MDRGKRERLVGLGIELALREMVSYKLENNPFEERFAIVSVRTTFTRYAYSTLSAHDSIERAWELLNTAYWRCPIWTLLAVYTSGIDYTIAGLHDLPPGA